MDIKEMEELGVFEVYSSLTAFIGRFLERNHPLTNEDIKAIIQGEQTNNTLMRQKVLMAMQERLNTILSEEMNKKKLLIEEFKQNPSISKLIDKDFISERNINLQKYRDEILEARWSLLNNEETRNPND